MYETPEGLTSVQTRSVVLTIPSYIASNLLRPLSVCQKTLTLNYISNFSESFKDTLFYADLCDKFLASMLCD